MKTNGTFTIFFTEKFQSIFTAFIKVYRDIYVSGEKISLKWRIRHHLIGQKWTIKKIWRLGKT